MKSAYFCAYHAERLKACESDAYRHWAEMMRRGAQAYVECRFDAANLYFGTALDIGLLRQECSENGLFSVLHIMKPGEFLVNLQLLEQRHEDAEATLDKISAVADPQGDWSMLQLVNFLAKAYKRVEGEGKSCLTQPVREMAYSVH
jgi:hypothetical protein